MLDERYFIHFEDFDLNKRIYQKYRIIFYPYVKSVHSYEKNS